MTREDRIAFGGVLICTAALAVALGTVLLAHNDPLYRPMPAYEERGRDEWWLAVHPYYRGEPFGLTPREVELMNRAALAEWHRIERAIAEEVRDED